MPFCRRVRSACIHILHVMKGLFQCIHMRSTLSSVGSLLFVVPLALRPPPPPPPPQQKTS